MLGTGLLVATVLPLFGALWGFSVDDAWIVTRVAENGLRAGAFAFNPGGPLTDAVTPLGFAELLAGLARFLGTEDVFGVARWLGAGALLCALGIAAWVALTPSDSSEIAAKAAARVVPWFAGAGLSPTLAAWAGAGLETPVVAALCTLGCAAWESDGGRARAGWVATVGVGALGVAVAWRPELVGFALGAGIQLERTRPGGFRTWTRFGRLLLVLLPPLGVAGLRWARFGSLLPLSLIAKEPDLGFGVRYLVGSLLLCGPLWLLWLLPTSSRGRRWLWAFALHGVCVLLAGGDWMPLYRLWLPVLPWLLAVTVRDWRPSRGGLALVLAAAVSNGVVLLGHGSSARSVIGRRSEMVDALGPLVADARVTATVDVGWVGRASRGEVVDLGGVTDPRVAALPGGHTSKRIDPGFFAARSVDTWLIRAADRTYVAPAPLETIQCVYAVDHRLTRRASDLGFRGVATIPLPGTGEQYVLARHE